MSFLDNLLARFGYSKAQAARYPDYLLATGASAQYSLPDPSAAQTHYRAYSRVSWVMGAVSFIANAVRASAVYSVYREEGEKLVDIPNHPFEKLMRRPNPLQSGSEFVGDLTAYYKLTGNAYIFQNKVNESAEPSELWVVPSDKIAPVPDGKSFLKGYLYIDNGRKIPLETWQICHIKTFNPHSPYVGLSELSALMLAALGDEAQQKWNLKFFDKNNAKPNGALLFASMMADSEWNKLKQDANEKWGGTERNGPMMLRGVGQGGVNWLSMAMSQKEMEFLESRKFTGEEIQSILAPGMASVISPNATEANAVAGKETLYEFGVYPVLKAIGDGMSNNILPAYGEGLVGEFDDVRRSNRVLDLNEQAAYERTHTVNEVRDEYYGDDPIEGGDVPIGEWKAATPEPAPEASATTAEMMPDTEAIQAEMKAWKAFAIKRLGKPTAREFAPSAIPLLEAARIKTALATCKTAADVESVFAGDDDKLLKVAYELLSKL